MGLLETYVGEIGGPGLVVGRLLVHGQGRFMQNCNIGLCKSSTISEHIECFALLDRESMWVHNEHNTGSNACVTPVCMVVYSFDF